ncbi:hypothetical protein PPL_09295 [Heterostelium album PN500]|uniref:Carbohydrate binding domain-containing protein n=1 Tax=Heterostelium pallidum (strain ATCC 26659 / Pp 5 / PN500) TaxID=670386 RepID=D3BL63_HETP5|nr:hypothetical protein PPL_09295 [Heterostelium album PN500]EFA77797.1 hypothetical protein PPL_09295 [Heterostelium album PN500]|eukprot:XP_020429925.1 hypothetical protein PPL_09295 [Heterostelium album PN500]
MKTFNFIFVLICLLFIANNVNGQCSANALAQYFNGSIIGVKIIYFEQTGSVTYMIGNSLYSPQFSTDLSNVNSFNSISSNNVNCSNNNKKQPFDVNQVSFPFSDARSLTISRNGAVSMLIRGIKLEFQFSYCSSSMAFGIANNSIPYSFYFSFNQNSQFGLTCNDSNVVTETPKPTTNNNNTNTNNITVSSYIVNQWTTDNINYYQFDGVIENNSNKVIKSLILSSSVQLRDDSSSIWDLVRVNNNNQQPSSYTLPSYVNQIAIDSKYRFGYITKSDKNPTFNIGSVTYQ